MARQFVLKPETLPAERELTIDYRGELNPQQYAAVTHGAGPALVVAGAGTGKTRTLIYRVAYLVETGVPPEEIVLLTFTRRSAYEMLSRASHLLDGRCQQVRGGTFHSFCLGLLRRYGRRIGYPDNFTILDSSDAADVIDMLRIRVREKRRDKRFPRKRTIQNIISGARNREVEIAAYIDEKYAQFAEFVEELSEIAAEYGRFKFERGLMDYDDLLTQTRFLFEEHQDILQAVSSRCRHVLVDEYQDTNRAQAALVTALSSVHRNVMVVGDDAQSIYRFRGADFRNILSFPRQVPGTTVLKLEQNYRSTGGILQLANHIIASARHRFDKTLFTDREGGEKPVLVYAPDTRYESRFVCQIMIELREQGVPLSDMAVLFRSGFNSYDLEVELNRRGIPFIKYGGLKLSEAAHIKDVLAHLKVLENPRDGVAWNRILQLIEGIGPKTALEIISWIDQGPDEQLAIDESRFSPRYASRLIALFGLLRTLHNDTGTLPEQIEAIITYYEPLMKQRHFEDFPKRVQDLEHFVALSQSFADRRELLASLALDPIELTQIDTEPTSDDEAPLILSTIHSAKGLEFNTVFLIQALDGNIPSNYSTADPEDEDEELRLLYVAVTRAAERLFISYPGVQFRGFSGQYLTRPSRFLEDVPELLLEPGSLVDDNQPQENGPALPQSADQKVLPEATGRTGAETDTPSGV